MTQQRLLIGLAGALLLVATYATSASAQDDPAQTKSHTAAEVTPYMFLGSGTSVGVGAALRWPLASHLSIELETNYRQAEIGALSSNLNLLFDLPRVGPVTPYVVGGVGLDQYGTAELLAGRVVKQERTAFSVNTG